VNDACPVDGFVPSSTECRAPAGGCDLAENCTGSSPTCPTDAKSTAECRAASDLCNPAETCDGLADDCPADALAPAGRVCRPSTGTCDVEESCDGATAMCPVDVTEDADGDGACDDDDLCPADADPGQGDGDGDGRGDACDPCTNVFHIFAQKGRIKLTKLDTAPGDDGMLFKGMLSGVPLEPTIDPFTNGIRVIIENTLPGGAFLDVTVPGGAGWKANKKGVRYANKAGFEGLTKIKLKLPRKFPGRVKFSVAGKNLSFGNVATDNLKGTLVIDLPMAVDGQCGEAIFPNQTGGACKMNKKGSKLSCR